MHNDDIATLATALTSQQLIPVLDSPSYEVLLSALTLHINNMINSNFTGLVQVLYRLDVSEQKLTTVLAENSGADAPVRIAELIISRELKRIETRRMYSNNMNIPEDEKW